MTILEYLKTAFKYIPSKRRPHNKTSISEIRSYLKDKSIVINNKRDWQPNDKAPKIINNLVIFPKGNKITLL